MDEVPSYDLFSKPDIAREIGFLIIYTATLEVWLFHALAALLRDKMKTASDILMPVDNIRAKVDILLNVATTKKGYPLANAILAHKDGLNAALAFRNAVAHSGFGFTLDGSEMTMVSHVTTGGRRGAPKSAPLKCETIRTHTMAVKDFIGAIRTHCGQGFVGIRNEPPPGTASRDKIVLTNRRPK